jgi:hypothetical protein
MLLDCQPNCSKAIEQVTTEDASYSPETSAAETFMNSLSYLKAQFPRLILSDIN